MDLAMIEEALAAYNGKVSPQDQARFNLFNALWGIMGRTSAQAAYGVKVPPASELVADLYEGQPFMANHPIDVDAESLADVVELLITCVCDSGAYQPDICTAMRALNMRQLIMLSDMDLASVDPEQYLNSLVDVLQNYGIEGSQITVLVGLVSLGLRALQEPAAAAMMRALPDDAMDDVKPNSCPVCGGRPTLAVVTNQRSSVGTGRKLACVQCGTQWEYDRVRCPHCGTTDVSKLSFRTVKGDPNHRIDFCEECGNYIRTSVVPNRHSHYSIDVEDCAMAAMDSYADQQGNRG